MEVRLTQEMLTAVKETPELPDNLRTRVIDAKAAGDLFVLKLDEDERVAMTEMCEWGTSAPIQIPATSPSKAG